MGNSRQINIEKFCNFYVSDVHLAVMLLPYISKQLNEDVEIATIFEKLEKQSIEEILGKMNVKNKEEILNINWFNNTKDINEKIQSTIDKNKEYNKNMTIIIGGNKEYIFQQNKNIINLINERNLKEPKIKIINCFQIEDVADNMGTIVEQYDGILNTSGEKRACAV